MDFAVVSISVLEGQEWKINRPIDIKFNQDVDFSTVSMNTINIVDETGNGATGFFTRPTTPSGTPSKRTVRFQPNCPTEEDNSDAGLQPRTTYQLTVLGSKVGGTTVRNTAGDRLELGALVTFHTPESDDPLALFLDTVPGPPAVRVRGAGGVALDDENATHIEIGGERVYFVMDLATQQGKLPAGFLVPLNHYSISENQIDVIVHLNQPVLATTANISTDFLVLEYDAGTGWVKLQNGVELVENCTETGAAVRLSPRGILPQDSNLRATIRTGFSDLTGDKTTAALANFARMTSVDADGTNPVFPGVSNPEVDEFYETFSLSGDDVGSAEDTQAAFEVPQAHWGAGELEASFAFGGTGGPEGEFDWWIPESTEFILNTVSDTITGGPDGSPTHTQAVINGVIDIRDLFIPSTSRLILVGPNPCTILASRNVKILGEISIRGSDSPGVGTLNTTNQPEPGAKGQGGGGDGGTGSFLTSQSTPRGGRGAGPGNAPNGGGQGGETSYATTGKDDRRGAGGGGGRFGLDVYHDWSGSNQITRAQNIPGLDAEYGGMGGPGGLGAVSQSTRARGGDIGPSPFKDDSDDNDFLGVMLTASGQLITGELDNILAGSGGGGGGDAVSSDSFPLVPFDIGGDEKGSGGGGGAGGLRILAIGTIQVGDDTFTGSVAAEGGDGGGGENTNFFDRVGGGSGAGSGGHIVFSSAAVIKIYGRAQIAGTWYRDNPMEGVHHFRPISAAGGQGGAGRESRGGANEDGPTLWRCDRIPFEYMEFPQMPPQDTVCFKAQPDFTDKEGGPTVGAGGDGSPGIIQFHVEDPGTRLQFPTIEAEEGLTYGTGLDVSKAVAPPPLGWKMPQDAANLDSMIPFFGRLSRAQSKWIPLGLARIDPGDNDDQVVLRFEGTAPGGTVPHDDSVVDQVPPLIGPDPLQNSPNPPYIGADGFSMVLDSTGLAGQDLMFTENPALLRAFSVKLEDSVDADNFQFFTITVAEHGGNVFTCHIDPNGQEFDDFTAAGNILVSLVPHYFRVLTSGIVDSYPADTGVKILFDATDIDSLTGGPDENSFGFTDDITLLNNEHWDFIRFQVEFDLDVDENGVDLDTPRPGIDHLRISFEF